MVLFGISSWAAADSPREYRVKYVAEGAVYLEGGRDAGLKEGMKLSLKRAPKADSELPAGQRGPVIVIGQVKVTSAAQVSAVCEILSRKEEIQVGDLAYLEADDAAVLAEQDAIAPTRKYPQTVTFTEGDPLEEEQRDSVPRPPLPEINRARGRIGLEYGGLLTGGAGTSGLSSQVGLVFRSDITRIGGTYWNLSGYWHGLLNITPAPPGQQPLTDLINRTYHLSMTYANPNSQWVAGFGRLYLPWATSLDTLDGGYFGRRIGQGATLGVFGGSTPDPTSWDYNPNRHLGGAFINFEGGSFAGTHYSATFGGGASSIGTWTPDRPFVFTDTSVSYNGYRSIYESLMADRPTIQTTGANGIGTTTLNNTAGIARSFLTVSWQPVHRFALDVNYNYFRDDPTFNLNLVSTGLVDKLLFQGLSVGSRIEVVKHVTFYDTFGRSSASGDSRASLNQMYGVTVDPIGHTGLRGDVHYAAFASPLPPGITNRFPYREMSTRTFAGRPPSASRVSGRATRETPATRISAPCSTGLPAGACFSISTSMFNGVRCRATGSGSSRSAIDSILIPREGSRRSKRNEGLSKIRPALVVVLPTDRDGGRAVQCRPLAGNRT